MRNYSIGEVIPKSKLAYFRERQKNKVFTAVLSFFEELAREKNLSKKDLARALGKDPAQVTRWFSGPSNWTLETVSDLLLAMNAEMDHKVHSLDSEETTDRKPVVLLSMSGEADKTYGGVTARAPTPITPIQIVNGY